MPDKKSSSNATDRESVASYDSTGKRKSFRRLFSRFAEKTSMQGVPYIHMAKFWWAKVIWSVLLLGAVAAMTLHLWFLFDQWYSWPKSTKVELGFEPLDFPQVTICNTNIMHKTRFYNYEEAEELRWLVEDLDPENFVSDQYDPNYTYGTGPTTESGQTTPAGSDTTQAQNVNGRRRKRYVQEYDNVNISKYDPDYENFEDEYYDDDDYYTEPLDSNTMIKSLFRSMYMDLDRYSTTACFTIANVQSFPRLRTKKVEKVTTRNTYCSGDSSRGIRYDRNYLGHQISDMLIECTFNGRKCSADQFELHQTSEYGNCWTISDRKFKVRKAGPSTGLSMILFLETNEFLKGITTGYGIRIHVQKRNTYPFPADEGIFIPASMETDIGIKLVNITRLGGDYGNCNDGKDFKALYNMTYSRRACQSFCQMSTVFKECSCFDDDWEEFAFTENKNLKPCRSKTESRCLLNIEKQFHQGNLTCTCENPCSEHSFTKSISQRQWPTNSHARVLLEWVCDRDIDTCETLRNDLNDLWAVNNNFLKLNIYFEDLNFENITETPDIEIQQFLSDVGGAVGLWIGLSILSLCELIQLVCELCYYGAHKVNKAEVKDKNKHDNKRNNEPSDKTLQDIDTNKENRWPHTVFSAGERPHQTRRPFSDRGGEYYFGNARRNGERYHDDMRYDPYSPRDHYDDIRDRDVDYRDAYRYDRSRSNH